MEIKKGKKNFYVLYKLTETNYKISVIFLHGRWQTLIFYFVFWSGYWQHGDRQASILGWWKQHRQLVYKRDETDGQTWVTYVAGDEVTEFAMIPLYLRQVHF